MGTKPAGRWPPGVGPEQALGYLLAHHVPHLWLAHGGLAMIQEAAGWDRPTGQDAPARPSLPSVDPALARSWLREAREHARQLGPPPGLDALLELLADGVIRSLEAATAHLRTGEAGQVADPRILIDLAAWCAAPVPFAVITIGARSPAPLLVYTRARDDLTRARTLTRALLKRDSILPGSVLTRQLAREGARVEAGPGLAGLRRILAVAGTGDWVWPTPDRQTPLTRTLARVAALGWDIPLRQIPAAIARSTAPRDRPVPGRRPLPVAAVRAWTEASPDWAMAGTSIAALTPRTLRPGRDHAMITALSPPGTVLPWTRLVAALQEQGMSAPGAAAAILWSPLVRRTPRGYRLLG